MDILEEKNFPGNKLKHLIYDNFQEKKYKQFYSLFMGFFLVIELF